MIKQITFILSLFVLFGSHLSIGCGAYCKRCLISRNVCLICNRDSILNFSTGTCEEFNEKVPNCEALDQKGKCRVCDEGYRVSEGDCEPCDENCAECSANFCTKCSTGFSLISGECEEKCQVSNCEACPKNHKVCGLCKAGFSLMKGECKRCKVKNCAVCSENLRSCQRCAPGFAGEACQLFMPGCLKLEADGKCQLCSEKYFMNLKGICQNWIMRLGVLFGALFALLIL